jgi:hypothetical protein
MKTLTVKQPWASLLVEGLKNIENRKWPTKHRGWLLIHAGKTFDNSQIHMELPLTPEQFEELTEKEAERMIMHDYPYGAIIGAVEIVDCVIDSQSIWAEQSYDVLKPTYNWVVGRAVKFANPLPVKGKLSLWEYDESQIKMGFFPHDPIHKYLEQVKHSGTNIFFNNQEPRPESEKDQPVCGFSIDQ